MSVEFYLCYQGMKTQAEQLDVLGHNLANLNTAGFKAAGTFNELLRGAVGPFGGPAGYIVGEGFTAHGQGALTASDNPLDLALEGPGFFVVQTPTGQAYTRNGGFTLDPDGFLVTREGYRVQGVAGDIRLEGDGRVDIDHLGNVSVAGFAAATLRLVDFPDYRALEKLGNSCFRPTGGVEPTRAGPNCTLRQGAIERSNVEPAAAMVELVTINRRFGMLQRAMMTLRNDIDKRLIDRVGSAR